MTVLNLEIQTDSKKYKLNLEIPKPTHATLGTRSLRSYGPKIWNALSYHIKNSDNLNSFKAIIKCWDGNHCTCRVYTYIIISFCSYKTSFIRRYSFLIVLPVFGLD